MRNMTRWLRDGLAVGVVAMVGLVGLTGCGARDGAAPAGPAMELTAEEQALTEMGYEPQEVLPGTYSSEDPDRRWQGRHFGRWRHPGRRVMHGELVVSTKQGPQTIVLQRGEVTEVSDTSMTVESIDGFTLTWTFGDKLRVVERRRTVDGDELQSGDKVAAVGAKSDDGGVARLIVVAPPE
jgi:hypothetical protein